MNFTEAIKAINCGKKVRRPCWKDGSYWCQGKKGVICWNGETKANIHINQVFAEDYELVEEEKTLSYFRCFSNEFVISKPVLRVDLVRAALGKYFEYVDEKLFDGQRRQFLIKRKEIFGDGLL